jgi:DNA mismatch endonuclease (patch repair protein)
MSQPKALPSSRRRRLTCDVDTLTPSERSERMRRVRQQNTAPELTVRKFAHRSGLRFRLHRPDLPGRPDIVFPRRRVALFVHGCFWHGHPGCRASRLPATNVDYWKGKIATNRARDARVEAALGALGWTPAVIWQCETRNAATLGAALDRALANERVDANQAHLEHETSVSQEL